MTQQTTRASAVLGDMDEDPANKKVVSVMYLSLGEAAQKSFKDNYPNTTQWFLKAAELLSLANECFQVEKIERLIATEEEIKKQKA